MGSPNRQLRYSSDDNFTERPSRDRVRAPKTDGGPAQLISTGDGGQDSLCDPLPIFTVEESIVMRAVSAGKCDKQLCIELRMPLQSFPGVLRDLMAKTRTTGLLLWVTRQRQGDRSYKMETTPVGTKI